MLRWQGSLSHHLIKEGKGRIERHNIGRFKEDKDLHPEDILILLQILFSRSILHNVFYCQDLYFTMYAIEGCTLLEHMQ